MASSGTFGFSPSNASILHEAFERIGMAPAALTRDHMTSAGRSMNMELLAWSNKGVNLWKVIAGTIALIAGTATYTLQSDLVTLTEVWYSQVNAYGTGASSDRFLSPLTRTEYAMLPNKLQPGTPTSYWFERLTPAPQITLWQPPAIGAPGYAVNWFGLQRIQDANLGSGETPDVAYRALDALCAGLARRLAEKFAPARLMIAKAMADEAWSEFIQNDQELGPLVITPMLGGYGQL